MTAPAVPANGGLARATAGAEAHASAADVVVRPLTPAAAGEGAAATAASATAASATAASATAAPATVAPATRRAELQALAAGLRRVATQPAYAATAVLFAVLYARPAYLLARDWWNNPEAGHGLLLAPLALWIMWRTRGAAAPRPNPALGGALLAAAVAFRWVADLAAELFVMRGSLVLGLAGLVVWYAGARQLLRWWLPFTLLALSIPLPELILSRVALPMQFIASKIGAGLLAWREIPVLLTGNVIRIPGHELFVAEACSGLRSLTALIALGVLLGAIALRHPASRLVLLASVLPVAILLNGVRVFLTGFLVYFVDPALGEGFMHKTEGMLVFGVAFAILAGVAWLIGRAEHRVLAPGHRSTLQVF